MWCRAPGDRESEMNHTHNTHTHTHTKQKVGAKRVENTVGREDSNSKSPGTCSETRGSQRWYRNTGCKAVASMKGGKGKGRKGRGNEGKGRRQ